MARYKIEIKQSAAKEIEALPKHGLIAVMEKIALLSENPRPHNSIKLTSQNKYRIRCGNYRILYSIEDYVLVVYVVKVAHRKDVYRKYG